MKKWRVQYKVTVGLVIEMSLLYLYRWFQPLKTSSLPFLFLSKKDMVVKGCTERETSWAKFSWNHRHYGIVVDCCITLPWMAMIHWDISEATCWPSDTWPFNHCHGVCVCVEAYPMIGPVPEKYIVRLMLPTIHVIAIIINIIIIKPYVVYQIAPLLMNEDLK